MPRAAALPLLALLLLACAPARAAGGDLAVLASPTDLPLAAAAWAPDGRAALAVGGTPGHGVVVRIADGQASLAGEDDHRWLAVAWSPAGAAALVAGDGGVLRTRDGAAFDVLAVPEGLSSFAGRAVAWKPDGSEALVAGSALLRYGAAEDRLEVVRAGAQEAFGAAAWAPDGSYALVEQAVRDDAGWHTGRLLRYDGTSLTHVATFGDGAALVEDIAFAPAGWALVAGAEPGQPGPVMRWDDAQLTAAFAKAAGHFTGIAWRPGGATALLTGAGGEPLAETSGQGYGTLRATGVDLLGAAWHPTGQRALLVGVGGFLAEWLPEGQPIVRVRAPLENALLQGAAEVLVHADPRPGHLLQAVEARVDDGPWRAMAALPSGDWHVTLATTGLAEGAHTLQVRARDDGATGAPARVQVRVLNGGPPAPSFAGLPASVPVGALGVRWTDTGADSYDLEVRFDGGAATFTDLHRSLEPGTSLALRAPGDHALRVRGWHGDAPSPWSAEAHVLWTEPPSSAQGRDASAPAAGDAGDKRAPGPEMALLLLGAAALALARRRP